MAVIAEQHARERRGAVGERRQQQRAVGNALRAGNLYAGIKPTSSRSNCLDRHRLQFLRLTQKAACACGSMVLYVFGSFFFHPAGEKRSYQSKNLWDAYVLFLTNGRAYLTTKTSRHQVHGN